MKSQNTQAGKQSVAFLIAVAVAGLLTMLIGAMLNPTQFWSRFVGTIGGGLLGSAFALMFSRIFAPPSILELMDQLTCSSSNPWVSNEDLLKPMRYVWHGYLLTKTNGKFVWRHRLFDFSRNNVSHQLHAVVEVPRPKEGIVRYRYDGFVCSHRMVLIGQRETGQEPCVIQVFPHLSQTDIHAGITMLETWDGDELVTATLLSKEELIKNAPLGTVTDNDGATLQKIWEEEFIRRFDLAPALAGTPMPAVAATTSTPPVAPVTMTPTGGKD